MLRDNLYQQTVKYIITLLLINLKMSILVVLLILNAIIGTLMLRWAWKAIKPIRDKDEARDSQFPPFRRMDL